MAREQFGVHHIRINDPAFPLVHPEGAERFLQNKVTAIIYAGNRTDVSQVDNTIGKVHGALGQSGKDANSRLWVVAPDATASALEGLGRRVLRLEEVFSCVDVDGVSQDFGVDLSTEDSRSGQALMAGVLFQRLLQEHAEVRPQHNLLVQGKKGFGDFPLQWMAHFTQKLNPLMIQQRQWTTSDEGMRYASLTLPRLGMVGQEWANIINERKWGGSSLVLVAPDALFQSPNATNVRAQDHILALSAAEKARETNKILVDVGRAYPNPPIALHSGDTRLLVTQNVFSALTDVLAAQGKRLSQADEGDYRHINAILSQVAVSSEYKGIGHVLPPVETLVRNGYIDDAAARKLVQREIGKQWVIPDMKDINVPESTEGLRELATRFNLIPNQDPKRLAGLVEEIIARIAIIEKTGEGSVYWGGQEGARPIYSLKNDPQLTALSSELAKLMVYNQPQDAHGVRHPVDINTVDMEPVRAQIERSLKKANIRVLVPFAGEEESIKGVLDYCARKVGKNKVIASDAGKSVLSTSIARESGVNTVDQNQILSRLDIDTLKKDGVLPLDFELKGSKSLTLLAGMIEIESQYQKGKKMKREIGDGIATVEQYERALADGTIVDDDTMIVFHDSDIMNSTEYNALDYLWLPMTFPPEGHTPKAIHMAKTGQGRNNEPMFTAISDYMNSKSPEIKKLGFALANLIWPLAGERAMRWGDLRNCQWTNGMGIETILDLQFGILDVESGEKNLYQVGNRLSKRENRPSFPNREMGMINTLQRLADAIKDAMKGNNGSSTRFLTSWDIHDIASFNRNHASRTFQMGFGDYETEDTRPNYIQSGIVDHIIPSIKLLVDQGYLKILNDY